MKKTRSSLLIAASLLVMTVSLTGCGGNKGNAPTDSKAPTVTIAVTDTAVTVPMETKAPIESKPAPTTTQAPAESKPAPTEAKEPVDPVSFDDTLFIGDSRTVGLMDFGKLKGDFFCNVGMSVYNINSKVASVPNVGKLTLNELLDNKDYGKIYIMLGINEIGYDIDKTVGKYESLVKQVREKEPNATIFIMANIHVSQKKSDEHKYLKNDSLNRLNKLISQLATGDNMYFLNPNTVYDDANGALDAKYTPDGVHFHPQYYVEFGNWLATESARVMKKG